MGWEREVVERKGKGGKSRGGEAREGKEETTRVGLHPMFDILKNTLPPPSCRCSFGAIYLKSKTNL